jgi:hypothetical protein
LLAVFLCSSTDLHAPGGWWLLLSCLSFMSYAYT